MTDQEESRKTIFRRVRELSALELDYTDLSGNLKHLAQLAREISGARFSLVNLLDDENQWTVARCGIEIDHMPNKQGLCQYTVRRKEPFEIRDFNRKKQYRQNYYMKADPELTYYLGIPVRTSNDVVIGTICLLDTGNPEVNERQLKQLKLTARGIAHLIEEKQARQEFNRKINQLIGYVNKVAHNVRNPIAAIISTADFMAEEKDPEAREELLNLIRESAESLLDYTDNQLQNMKNLQKSDVTKTSLSGVIEKLKSLYQTQADYNSIELRFDCDSSLENSRIPYSSGNLIHILGSVISGSLKRTPRSGRVEIQLSPHHDKKGRFIKVSVRDNGTGIEEEEIEVIEKAAARMAADDTVTEEGVVDIGLCESLSVLEGIGGSFTVHSEPDKGTQFDLYLPISSLIMNPLLKIAN